MKERKKKDKKIYKYKKSMFRDPRITLLYMANKKLNFYFYRNPFR